MNMRQIFYIIVVIAMLTSCGLKKKLELPKETEATSVQTRASG